MVLLGGPADCGPVWPSLSLSDSILFSVGGRAVTLGDTLPLLGESVLSSVRKTRQEQYLETDKIYCYRLSIKYGHCEAQTSAVIYIQKLSWHCVY